MNNDIYIKNNKKKFFEHWRIITLYLLLFDIFAVNFSYFFALLLRFDLTYSKIPIEYLSSFVKFAPYYTIFCIISFLLFHLYSSMWRFASFNELNRILLTSVVTTIFNFIGMSVFVRTMPISYFIIGSITQMMMIVGIRFSYRYVVLIRDIQSKKSKDLYNAMIIGAGEAGQLIIKDLKKSNSIQAKPVCIIDDNTNKWGRYIDGVPIVGGRDVILKSVEKYNVDKIMFAAPSASNDDKKNILNICKETNCELTILPNFYNLHHGETALNKLKPVQVEDLLGRDPIKINLDEIFNQLKNKTILVTGGGGSIGSELCRQIVKHNPKRLIIFDIYENNAYDIEQELKRKYPLLDLVVLIGSVRDKKRVDYVFKTYHPDYIYHAAAHKHVPLMENSPCEAIKNNVIGTYNVSYAALKYDAKSFVLVSTDKAVNPTNIMGASKRLCEMVIQSMDKISSTENIDLLHKVNSHIGFIEEDNELDLLFKHNKNKTRFVAVRFGNVLGSNGSVIPLFKKQIEEGGPVTVTHPDVIRYFMTIPEAVSLILQAGTYAKGGEIFVLDMGAPVKIDTLARNLIHLSGLEPDKDIKIVYTGLRPGEKLFEEKLMEEEGLEKTDNELIHIGKPIKFNIEKFINNLKELDKISKDNSDKIIKKVMEVVPTFNPVGKKPTGYEHKDSIALKKQRQAMANKKINKR